MRPVFLVPSFLFAVLALGGCSGSSGSYSGIYVADIMGGKAELDFVGGNKVNVSLVSPDGKDRLTHHSVFAIDGNRMLVTTDEPMGVPMHLTIDGGTLKDDTGAVFTKR